MADDLFYRVTVKAGPIEYDLSHDLSSFTIEEEAAKPDQLTLHMSDPFKVFSHALREGMEIEVDLGSVKDHSVIFRGQIYKTEGGFPQDGVPALRLLAYDRSLKMGLRKRNRAWTDTTLSGIVNDIGQQYFDAPSIQVALKGDPKFTGNGIRQQDETDLAFLLRLAAHYGCEMFVVVSDKGEALHFESQYHIMKRDPEVTLYYGRTGVANCLLSFEASSDLSDIQLPRVFGGIDYESGQPTEAAAVIEQVGTLADPFFDENLTEFARREPLKAASLDALISASAAIQQQVRMDMGTEEMEQTLGFATQQELQVRAQNQFSTSIHGMRGSGTAAGNQRILAHTVVSIADVGGRFSGIWYLSQVRHVLNGQGYLVEFQCRR